MDAEGDIGQSGTSAHDDVVRHERAGEAEPEPEPEEPGGGQTETGLAVEIVRLGGDWSSLEPVEAAVGEVVAALAAEIDIGPDATTAALALSSDPHVHELNRTHRGQDKPTNVLSFPVPSIARGDDAPDFLGDVIIAHETLSREASDDGKVLRHHFQHLVLHGLLHLLGFDHETEDDAREMEAIEVAVLARIAVPDPYQHSSLEEQKTGHG